MAHSYVTYVQVRSLVIPYADALRWRDCNQSEDFWTINYFLKIGEDKEKEVKNYFF